jgi:hypothetical protein
MEPHDPLSDREKNPIQDEQAGVSRTGELRSSSSGAILSRAGQGGPPGP